MQSAPMVYNNIKAYYHNLVPQMQEEDWLALQEKLSFQSLKKGDYLTKAGDVCRQVSFVSKGLLRMFYLVDGNEVSVAFASENDYLAEYDSFLTRQPSAGNIDALEETELINLSYDSMQSLYLTHPIFERFGRKIAEMLFIMVSSQTNRLLTQTPEERYLGLLQTQSQILQRVPQYMIASYIGITPEHLSRIRRKRTAK